jgi:hypothetical protein
MVLELFDSTDRTNGVSLSDSSTICERASVYDNALAHLYHAAA